MGHGRAGVTSGVLVLALLGCSQSTAAGIGWRQVAEYLFATTNVNRVEASTDVDNLAEQRALEKAGFPREGVLRGAQFRSGAHHDLFSRLRDDPQ